MDARTDTETAATASAASPERAGAAPARGLFTRGRLFALLGAAVLVVAIVVGLGWLFVGSHHVSTDDAYVNADVADITPLVAGPIISAPAKIGRAHV